MLAWVLTFGYVLRDFGGEALSGTARKGMRSESKTRGKSNATADERDVTATDGSEAARTKWTVDAAFQVRFVHRVRFTRHALEPANPTLAAWQLPNVGYF